MNAGCAGKTVISLENVRHTWAPLDVFTTRRYTNPHLPYLCDSLLTLPALSQNQTLDAIVETASLCWKFATDTGIHCHHHLPLSSDLTHMSVCHFIYHHWHHPLLLLTSTLQIFSSVVILPLHPTDWLHGF